MTRIAWAGLLGAFLCAGWQEVLLTVNGQTVVSDKLIDSALSREIARMNGIEPTAAELTALRKKWAGAAAKAAPLAPTQRELDEEGWYQLMRRDGMGETEARERAKRQLAEMSAMKKKMDDGWVEALALGFKVNRLLWSKHGGRLVLSAFGFHQATDAFAVEVLQLERTGVARFHNTAVREDFYRRMQTYTGDGVVGGERASQILSKPPWE